MSDLDAIRARANAATPGPWTLHEDGLIWPERVGDPICRLDDMQDAEFIAHAREDIPALLAEIERLRANQLPDGGQWRTEYGHAGGGRTWFDNYPCGRPQCNFTRRVWTGAAEPTEAELDEARGCVGASATLSKTED